MSEHKPIASEEGNFNTGDIDLDNCLEFAFRMGANAPMNMDCGILFMEDLDKLKEKIVQPGHVKIPKTVEEAHAYIALGHAYLKDNGFLND